MTDYNMKGYDVVKATSLTELKQILKEKIRIGFTPLGLPSVIYMRDKLNIRITVFYQSVALVRVTR